MAAKQVRKVFGKKFLIFLSFSVINLKELGGKKNVFADPHTETENDTPNASKSIIKVHNGNISLAGDESSLLGGRLNETIESDINTSRNEGGEGGVRTKGLTFGEKREVTSNKILGEEFS